MSPKNLAQQINPRNGHIINWNGGSAPLTANSDYNYGATSQLQRVVMILDGINNKDNLKMEDLVSVMNRGASTYLYAKYVWPHLRSVLVTGPIAPKAAEARDLIDTWVNTGGASWADRNGDGKIDYPGYTVLDLVRKPLNRAILGSLLTPDQLDLYDFLNPEGTIVRSQYYGFHHIVDKDLRTLLGEKVKTKLKNQFCGDGEINKCRQIIEAQLVAAVDELITTQGTDPSQWLSDVVRVEYTPFNFIGEFTSTHQRTNRGTIQQLMEFNGHRPR